MKRLALLALLAACPPKQVTIYRSLSEPGAMQTCDANLRFRAEAKGANPRDATARLEAMIRDNITSRRGCAALIFNEASGKALDGSINAVADYQFCRC